ncbi:actin-related protein 2/3 complex subunit 1A-like [Mirounga leonina]|uniref:actin-related protein 2/3 complex subunit 1A-like n=1 Tax=Mirounga leonina TaxID=9715 RepID=UPI00156C061F|nr:actin-related protein 2/3 complex subunit 1A-like [Mirounga leonina]
MPWGSKMPLGQLMSEFAGSRTGGGVHGVSSSPSGSRLAWVRQDCFESVADASRSVQGSTLERRDFLPLPNVAFVSENSAVAAGHDCCPGLFNYNDRGCLTFMSKLDIPSQSIGGNMSAKERFQPRLRTATQPWRCATRTASRKCLFRRWTSDTVANCAPLPSMGARTICDFQTLRVFPPGPPDNGKLSEPPTSSTTN